MSELNQPHNTNNVRSFRQRFTGRTASETKRGEEHASKQARLRRLEPVSKIRQSPRSRESQLHQQNNDARQPQQYFYNYGTKVNVRYYTCCKVVQQTRFWFHGGYNTVGEWPTGAFFYELLLPSHRVKTDTVMKASSSLIYIIVLMNTNFCYVLLRRKRSEIR
jgi:hypothetical protein